MKLPRLCLRLSLLKRHCRARLPAIGTRYTRLSRSHVASSALVLLLLSMLLPAGVVNAAVVSGELRQWFPINVDFTGPESSETDSSPNPFLDYRLTVLFTSPTGNLYKVPGFFAGNGAGNGDGNIWRVRFSADEAGKWSYVADFRLGSGIAVDLSDNPGETIAFHGESGEFDVVERNPEAPGFLKSGRLEVTDTHYLKFRDGPYWLKGGTDSPENFLAFAGFDNTQSHGGIEPGFLHLYESHVQDANETDPFFENEVNGVNSRGITGSLNYLAGQGVNSIYFLPMNLGGDGQDTYPFVGAANTAFDKTHYDISKLQQWDLVLDHAQRQGIAAHFVLSETELANERWLDNGLLGVERKLYLREMIARFGYLMAGKWNIGEESDFPVQFLRETADYIGALDWSSKPISVHTHIDYFQDYDEIVGDPRFTATSIQYTPSEAGRFVEQWRARSREAGRPWVVDMDENTNGLMPGNADRLRKEVLYDVYFSGGNIEWYFGYAPQPVGGDINAEDFRQRESMWRSMRIAREFMENYLPFWEMEPADLLVNGESSDFGGAEVFAKEGEIYAVYLPNASGRPGIDLTASPNAMMMRWFDPRSGQFAGEAIELAAAQLHDFGSPPSSDTDDWVLLLTRLNPDTSTTTADTNSTPDDAPAPETVLVEDAAGGEVDDEVVDEAQPDADSPTESLPDESSPDASSNDSSPIVEEPAVNRAPEIEQLDDQTIQSGVNVRQLLRAVDPDGPVPSLYLVTAPQGSRLDDNGDGTRSLVWETGDSDVGQHIVRVASADAMDSSLISEMTFSIFVELPETADQTPAQDDAEAAGDADEAATPAPADGTQVEEPQIDQQGSEDNQTVSVDLTTSPSENLPPLIISRSEVDVRVGQRLLMTVLPVDPEGRVPDMGIDASIQGLLFVDNLNGTRTVDWTPQAEDRGRFDFVLTATDALDRNLVTSKSLVINVLPLEGDEAAPAELIVLNDNQPPIFPNIADREVNAGEEIRISVQPVDPEGFAPVLHVSNAPASARFDDTLNGTRELVWTPGEDDRGEHSFRFVAVDSQDPSLSDSVTVQVTVR